MLIDKLVRYYDKMAQQNYFKAPDGTILDYTRWFYPTNVLISLNEDGTVQRLIRNEDEVKTVVSKKSKKGMIESEKISYVGKAMVYPVRPEGRAKTSFYFEFRPLNLIGFGSEKSDKDKKKKKGKAPENIVEDVIIEVGTDEKVVKPKYFITEESREAFEIVKQKNIPLVEGIDTPIAKAVYNYFKNFNIDRDGQNILNMFFELFGEKVKLTESMACTFVLNGDIETAWNLDKKLLKRHDQLVNEDTSNIGRVGADVVTGETEQPLARLHMAIKGISTSATSKNPKLVTFNREADQGYAYENGKSQCADVSGISIINSMKYRFALTWMLRWGSLHCINYPEMSIIFWSDVSWDEDDKATSIMSKLLGNSPMEKEKQETMQVKDAVDKLRYGTLTEDDIHFLKEHIHNKFMIVGLGIVNTEIVKIQFCYEDAFQKLLNTAEQYAKDICVEAWGEPYYPSMYKMLQSTFPTSLAFDKKKYRNNAVISAMQMVTFTNQNIPFSLYQSVVGRCLAEPDNGKYSSVTPERQAVIKGYLNRKNRKVNKEEFTMALDENRMDVGYVCGRIFAAAENIQYRAMGELDSNIKTKKFKLAGTTPVRAYPGIVQMTMVYLDKLKGGTKVVKEKHFLELLDKIENNFPKVFNAEQQGAFILGYAQQRTVYFKESAAQKAKSQSATENDAEYIEGVVAE